MGIHHRRCLPARSEKSTRASKHREVTACAGFWGAERRLAGSGSAQDDGSHGCAIRLLDFKQNVHRLNATDIRDALASGGSGGKTHRINPGH